MCSKLVITLHFCLISSLFEKAFSDEMMFIDTNQEDSSSLLYNYHERKSECFHNYLANCNASMSISKCLDDFSRIVHYNDSGCINSVLDCNCETYDATKNTVEIGRCFFGCQYRHVNMIDYTDDTFNYITMPPNVYEWNEVFCGKFNRSGTLCGKCQNGLYTQAYSFDLSCVECTNVPLNWCKYLLVAYLPLTCFCVFILTSKLVVPSTLVQGFVLYCQFITKPITTRDALFSTSDHPLIYRALQLVASLYGIWNLDFIRTYSLGICLQTDTLTTIALDLAVAIYPLVFILLTYFVVQLHDANFKPLVIIWKPFKLVFGLYHQWDTKASIVDCFGTFMLLSSVKLLNVCFDILIPVEVITILSTPENNMTRNWRVYYDASIPYFSIQHLPYAFIAIVVLVTNILAPTLILLLYPFSTCQRFLNTFPHRWQLVIHTFVDSFQGCYKDRTQTKKLDYRHFSAMPFVIRALFFILYATTLNAFYTPLAAIFWVLVCLLYLNLDPFKDQHYSVNTIIFIFLLASFCVCCIGGGSTYSIKSDYRILFLVLAFIVGFLPLLYLTLCIMAKLHSKITECKKRPGQHLKHTKQDIIIQK